MAYDGIVLAQVIKELKEKIIGLKVDKIFQPEKDEINILFRNKNRLKLSINSSMPYMTLTDQKKSNPPTPPNFLIILRKYLSGAILKDIEQVGMDRVVRFSFVSRNELGDVLDFDLIYELMGKHSNLILVNDEDVIIDSLKRVPPFMSHVRQILPNIKFKLIENSQLNIMDIDYEAFKSKVYAENEKIFKVLYQSFQGLSPAFSKEILYRCQIEKNMIASDLSDLELSCIYDTILKLEYNDNFIFLDSDGLFKDFHVVELSRYDSYINKNSTLELIDDFYRMRDIQIHIRQKSTDLRKLIDTRIKRIENKLENLYLDMNSSLEADEYMLKGELIISNLHQIKKGMENVDLINYYTNENIIIKLDTTKTPQENSQIYYKKYNKMKTAKLYLETEIEKAKKELEYLYSITTSIENTVDDINLELIKEELISEGYIKSKGFKKPKKLISKPHEFKSDSGFIISVGKNNKENDMLTFKKSSNSDIWLHVKDIPGSHVIISTKGKDVDDETLLLAGQLAAYYSKSRLSSNVPVDYTEVRHVKKPSGAKPGFVNYFHQHTLYVTPDEEKLLKFKV
jgi:predicted ribosome quality control (RQC) complex YloA/Tae2 family protein